MGGIELTCEGCKASLTVGENVVVRVGTRRNPLKERLLGGLGFMVAVAALCSAATFGAQPDPPRENLAALLPEGTVAYLRLGDLQKITDALEQSGVNKRILSACGQYLARASIKGPNRTIALEENGASFCLTDSTGEGTVGATTVRTVNMCV